MKFMLFPELAQLSQALSHSSQECTVHTRIEAYSCKPIKKDKKLSKAMETNFQEVKAEIKQSVGSPDEDDDSLYASPFGQLNKPQSRKTLYLLIQLLNVAFPDYDFTEAKADHFCKEVNGANVLQALSQTLEGVRTRSGPHLIYAPRSYSTYPPTSPEFFPSSSPSLSSSPSKSPILLGLVTPSTSPLRSRTPPIAAAAGQPPAPLSSGTNPALYQLLDKVISLEQCDVYSYMPDIESDPHADDSDSDSDSDDQSSPEEDYYDLPFEDLSGSPPKSGITITKTPYGDWDDDDAIPGAGLGGGSVRRKSHGGLLWSSHWFFHNKKQKRVLFITIWAKKRRSWAEPAEEGGRFSAWHGSVGAGARALGLPTRNHTI